MSTCKTLESFKGRGSVWMAEILSPGVLGPWFQIAEARRLEIQIEQDFEDQYSRCDVNSGNIIHNINQTDYNMELDAFDFSSEMLAKAYYGTTSTVTTNSVTDENFGTVAAGESVVVEHPFNLTSVTVYDDGVSKTVDVDYTIDTDHGVITAINAFTTDLEVDYTYATYDKIEGVVTAQKNWAFRFDGYNINNSGKEIQVYLWQVALDTSSILSLISEETNVLTLTGKMLSDNTKGSGESEYFVVKKLV